MAMDMNWKVVDAKTTKREGLCISAVDQLPTPCAQYQSGCNSLAMTCPLLHLLSPLLPPPSVRISHLWTWCLIRLRSAHTRAPWMKPHSSSSSQVRKLLLWWSIRLRLMIILIDLRATQLAKVGNIRKVKPNPYVVISFQGKELETSVRTDTVEPEWSSDNLILWVSLLFQNHTLILLLCSSSVDPESPDSVLHFKVYHRNKKSSPELRGECGFSLRLEENGGYHYLGPCIFSRSDVL